MQVIRLVQLTSLLIDPFWYGQGHVKVRTRGLAVDEFLLFPPLVDKCHQKLAKETFWSWNQRKAVASYCPFTVKYVKFRLVISQTLLCLQPMLTFNLPWLFGAVNLTNGRNESYWSQHMGISSSLDCYRCIILRTKYGRLGENSRQIYSITMSH